MNSRIFDFYRRAPLSRRVVVGGMFSVFLAACSVSTDDDIESDSTALRSQGEDDFDKAYGPEPELESSDFVGDDGSGLRVLSLDRNETRQLVTNEERARIDQFQRELRVEAPLVPGAPSRQYAAIR